MRGTKLFFDKFFSLSLGLSPVLLFLLLPLLHGLVVPTRQNSFPLSLSHLLLLLLLRDPTGCLIITLPPPPSPLL